MDNNRSEAAMSYRRPEFQRAWIVEGAPSRIVVRTGGEAPSELAFDPATGGFVPYAGPRKVKARSLPLTRLAAACAAACRAPGYDGAWQVIVSPGEPALVLERPIMGFVGYRVARGRADLYGDGGLRVPLNRHSAFILAMAPQTLLADVDGNEKVVPNLGVTP